MLWKRGRGTLPAGSQERPGPFRLRGEQLVFPPVSAHDFRRQTTPPEALFFLVRSFPYVSFSTVKPTTLLLLASLLANVAFVAVLATRSPAPATASALVVASGAASANPAGKDDALRAALAAGNAAALQAAGVAPELARELVLGRTFSRLVARARAERATQPDGRWWRNSPGNALSREQQLLMRREMSEALMASFGDDAGFFGPGDSGQLAFLPAAKRDALRRITQDYDEMMAKFSAGGVQLASDKEKLRLLRAERESDIAALLTPEERLAYEMRTSPTAATVRSRYGDGIQSEEDFRKLYALQKAFDEKYPVEGLSGRITPETMRARSDAQRQLQDDIRSALGETGYATLRRATDSDLRTVDSLVTRLNLPANTTDRVAAARETFGAESQRINADASIPVAQRRAQIQELGTRAKAEVQQALGAEAAEAYLPRSSWVGMLQNGLAYTTSPQPGSPAAMMAAAGNQSVFPVLPAGAGTPGTARQMIYTSGTSSTTDLPAGHGDVFLAGPAGEVRENVRVMTFSTTTAESASASGAATASGTILVAPAPTTPPPK
jgi:hypothetical protein